MKYQIGNEEIEIDRLLASLFSEEKIETTTTAICWFIQKDNLIAPIEIQQEDDPLSCWQRLLNPDHTLEIELLVNPLGQGEQQYLQHPVVKSLNDISQSWGRCVPDGDIAETLHPFNFSITLSSLSFHKRIIWDYFPAKDKMFELIKRKDFLRASVGALSQGLIYLAASTASEREYKRGSLVSVQPHRRRRFPPNYSSQESYRIGNSTYRPRRNYY